MPEPLKNFFSPTIVTQLAEDLTRAHPSFPRRAFVRAATAGLADLELLARGRHIASALSAHLPPNYPDAIDVLLRSLGSEHATDELVGAGMAPFFYLPHVLFVAERGLDHFDLSMRAQYELTKRFSAEVSIRAYIEKAPEQTCAVLRKWATDDHAHVRRLVSEGTRLRLPWTPRVAWLDDHPERVLELLELLKDDPTTLVRRSVANNLNDLGKVHPELLVDTCDAWMRDPSATRCALVEHALRSAVKRGEPGALKILGFDKRPAIEIQGARFDPAKVAIGDRVVTSFTLRSTTRTPQRLLLDLRVHFVKANGKPSPKVFKLARIELAGRQARELSSSVSLAVHTTRKPYPGEHRVELLANGTALPLGSFTVVDSQRARAKRHR